MKLEIVAHCWNYGRLLTCQLSSIQLYPPRDVDLTFTVFHAPTDAGTVRVLDFFQGLPWPPNVRLRRWELPPERLLRRLVGRNLAALANTADWVWFTDCDYLFREGALDALPGQVAGIEEVLVYPGRVFTHRDHALGDRLIASLVDGPRIVDVDPAEFRAERNRRAIGGVQIARGDMLRSDGYCRDGFRQRIPGVRWVRTCEDQQFRYSLHTRGRRIEMPGVFRIRHGQCGRKHEGVVL